MKTIKIQMTYRTSQILTTTVGMMYCCGPPYHRIKQSLSHEHNEQLSWLSDKYVEDRDIYRKNHPGMYQNYPLSDEESNRILEFDAMPLDLQLMSVALRETIIEATGEVGQKELEIVTTHTLKEVQDVLEVIQRAMRENHIDELVP